MPTQKYK